MPGLALLSMFGGLFGAKGKMATALGGVLAVALLVGALWGGWAIIKHNVIATHDAKQDASNSKADRRADQAAAGTRRTDDRRLATEEAQLKEVQEHAKGLTPAERKRARYDCIRLQQDARAKHREPPPCGGPAVPSGAGRTHG